MSFLKPSFSRICFLSLGIIADSANEIVQLLTAEIERFIKAPVQPPAYNEAGIRNYSRKNQVQHLAEILNRL